MIGLVEMGGGVPLLQVKITLKESKPAIWRRVVVREDMRLDRFHNVIQIAMGWTDSHLHQFIVGKTCYGIPDPDFADGGGVLNEKRHKIAELASMKRFIYEYDFGDGWHHDIVVEKVLPADPTFKHPVCLDAANACPPEDCGGIYGYYRLLEILADRKHPEHAEMKEWIGGKWDAADFDVKVINGVLKRMKA